MKKWTLLFALGMPCVAFSADHFNYRADDPFLFCHDGMKIPDPCWIPTDYVGGYAYTGVCDPPNEEGRSWTADDTEALKEYVSICPKAIQSGEWSNKAGAKDATPFVH